MLCCQVTDSNGDELTSQLLQLPAQILDLPGMIYLRYGKIIFYKIC